MPPTEQQLELFELREVVKALARSRKFSEGHFELAFEFNIAVGSVGPTPDQLLPGAMFGISKLGLKKVETPTKDSVDASTLWEEASPAG